MKFIVKKKQNLLLLRGDQTNRFGLEIKYCVDHYISKSDNWILYPYIEPYLDK